MHSALAGCYRRGRFGRSDDPTRLSIQERPISALFQIAGWPDSSDREMAVLTRAIGLPSPMNYHKSATKGETFVFAVSPATWLFLSEDPSLPVRVRDAAPATELYLTDLSHARTCVRLSGADAATLLLRGLPIDLSDAAFPASSFAQSCIHGMPVLVHRLEPSSVNGHPAWNPVFDIFLQRTFAVSFWDWLVTHAAGLGYDVL
jgi:sarcosine oxidase subunit gamma